MNGDRLILVRHGITDWNREGRWQGRLDPPLSEDGRREASQIAERVARDPGLLPVRIISSTLTRATQTAERIAEVVGVSVELDARLMEIGAGKWEGRTHAELETIDGDRYRAWRSQASGVRPPGGERMASAVGRVTALLAELRRTDGAWPVCLVSHGGILRVVARVLLRLSPSRSWSLDVDNASISAAVRVGRLWRLERWNDTGHLLGRERTHVDEAEGRPLAL